MKCPNCNHKIDDKALFCTECGCNIKQFLGTEENEFLNTNSDTGFTKQKEKKSKIPLISYFIIIVILFLMGVGYCYLTYSKNSMEKWIDETMDSYYESDDIHEIQNYIQNDVSEKSEQIEETSLDSQQSVMETDSDSDVLSEEIDTQEYIIPDSSTKRLEENDIKDLTKEELRLARNEIYARHGRLFDDTELQSYFDKKSWYNGTVDPENFKEEMLSDIEKDNIKLIKEYEQ